MFANFRLFCILFNFLIRLYDTKFILKFAKAAPTNPSIQRLTSTSFRLLRKTFVFRQNIFKSHPKFSHYLPSTTSVYTILSDQVYYNSI
ncbi:hypothetical protein V6Z11_A08G295200 [Gossypium hirsutum]